VSDDDSSNAGMSMWWRPLHTGREIFEIRKDSKNVTVTSHFKYIGHMAYAIVYCSTVICSAEVRLSLTPRCLVRMLS
jgi:hypothetical protein